MLAHPPSIQIDSINHESISAQGIQLDLLRLDQIHAEISGNKWFKLKYNIEEAISMNAKLLISFGGAYSNHLHALAYAGKLLNIATIGIVRGDKVNNPTLRDCMQWGMKLIFITRENYKLKNTIEYLKALQNEYPLSYIIPEGGDNELGIKGCEFILNESHKDYNYICCCVGTGTTFSGLIRSSTQSQHLLGFAALKGAAYLQAEIEQKTHTANWQLLHNFHFGGFAKVTPQLLEFIDAFKLEQHINLDKVYTSKMLFGLFQLINEGYFKRGEKVLAIHSGGLQGNRT